MGANASMPDSKGYTTHSRSTMGSQSANARPTSLGARYSQYLCTADLEHVTPRDKKKKASKFATLRKKLIRARRSSRSLDYSKVLRELTSSWSVQELNALVEEYEASIALKELAMLASLARPHANSIKEDLSQLYDYKYCTDVDLIYKGVVFPVHRAILCVRCPYFRELLTHYPEYGAQVHVKIRTPGVDVNTFSSLLRYLYTGEFSVADTKLNNLDLLVQLGQEFGTPSPLEQDLRRLMETGIYSDAVLIFSTESEHHEPLTPEGAPSAPESRTIKHELRCHKAILAARSPFFRNLVLRRARSGEELTERALQSPTCIILDECVIPRRYARVLLQAIYLDSVNLSCIVRSSVSMCSLSEVQAMVAGKGQMTMTDEAMEIYQIARFIDFPMLAQGCEDLIVDSLSADNLVSILTWSEEAHGSPWVHRQALHFLREEFTSISHSPLLYDLSKHYLMQAVKSEFLQAGELDVLSAVLKWGEHELVKRIEEREPNLLSHTAHSISKKGVKKRDLNDVELRDILAELLPYVQTDHVLPASHEVLSNAIKRGLVSVPPSHMIGDGGHTGHSPASVWVRCGGKNNGMFMKPRLFMPYYEEAKALLDEHLSQVQENEVVRLRMVHMSSAIPDTLYMVDEAMYVSHSPQLAHRHIGGNLAASSTSTVDIIAGTIPVPDADSLKAMHQREAELQQSRPARRAYGLPCTDHRDVTHYIRLRVVREFGLPDSCSDILHSKTAMLSQCPTHMPPESPPPLLAEACYHTPRRGHMTSSAHSCSQIYSSSPHSGLHHSCGGSHHRYHQHHHHHHHHLMTGSQCGGRGKGGLDQRRSPSTPVSPTRSYSPVEKEPSACSDSLLSDMMPDIAMATASLNQVSLNDLDLAPPQAMGDLELDLGDGNNHSGTGTLYI